MHDGGAEEKFRFYLEDEKDAWMGVGYGLSFRVCWRKPQGSPGERGCLGYRRLRGAMGFG